VQSTIILRGETIPVRIRSYANTKNIRIFFHNNILCVSKPKGYSVKKIEKLLRENASTIWEQYQKGKANVEKDRKEWKTGETMWIQGEEYTVVRMLETEKRRIRVQIKDTEKTIEIYLPEENTAKEQIDKKVIQVLKERTKERIQNRLPYWSAKTNFSYQTVRISDTKSKYGSCMPKKEALQFSARLAMLSPEEVDMVIVHELCHFRYANHSKDFYELLGKYIPDYKEIIRNLKKADRKIIF